VIKTGPSKILTLIMPLPSKNNRSVLFGVNRKMKMKVLTNLPKLRRVMHLTGLHQLGVFLWYHPRKKKRVKLPKRMREMNNWRKVSKKRSMKIVKRRKIGVLET
jgi:hypothetical protein